MTATDVRRRSAEPILTAELGRSNLAVTIPTATGTSARVNETLAPPSQVESCCTVLLVVTMMAVHVDLLCNADGAGSTVDAPFEMNVNGQMLILQDAWNQAPHSTNSGPTRPELLYPDTYCGGCWPVQLSIALP